MTTAALLLSFALKPQTVDKPTLQYYQQTFVIRRDDSVLRIPLQAVKPKPPLFVAFRKNQTFAVWDDRGLTVRRGKRVASTRLTDYVVSPRVYSHDEIVASLDQFQEGLRSQEATGLSGAKRLGNDAFFLIRWDDKAGKPWTEVLVRVDMTSKKPAPILVGRFDSISTATKPIDDKLQFVNNKLAIVGRTRDDWRLSTYDPATNSFSSQPMGDKLGWFEYLNPTQGLFIETSSYGTTIAGKIDLGTGTRKLFYESRLPLRFVDAEEPVVILAAEGDRTKLINASTGIVRTIQFPLEARRAAQDMLFWTPASNPKAIWLLDPRTWKHDARLRIK